MPGPGLPGEKYSAFQMDAVTRRDDDAVHDRHVLCQSFEDQHAHRKHEQFHDTLRGRSSTLDTVCGEIGL